MRCCSCGEVSRAIDKTTKKEVAIKSVKMTATDERCENEWKTLKECKSDYVVEFYDAFYMGNELRVWFG